MPLNREDTVLGPNMAFIHLEVYQITEAANRLATSDINKGVSTVVQGVMEEVVNQLYTTCSATGREGGIASAHTKKESVEDELHRLAVLPKHNIYRH